MIVYICTKFHQNIFERYQSYGADVKRERTDRHNTIRLRRAYVYEEVSMAIDISGY